MSTPPRDTPGVYRSEQGGVLHLYLPGYQPGKKQRSMISPSGMCGAAAYRVLWYHSTGAHTPYRWCGKCVGLALSHYGLLAPALRLRQALHRDRRTGVVACVPELSAHHLPRDRRTPVTSPPEKNVRPFSTFLLEQAQGRSHEELSDNLHELIAKVRDTGKKGSLTYTVTVSPLDKEVRSFKVEDQIKAKYPEHDRPTSIFYPDKDGNLSRRDPNQMSFDDLAVLPEPAGLNRATGEIPMENTP